MKTLKIDDKWSVEYDPENNDRPVAIMRHGEPCSIAVEDWKNDSVAMFYALLEARRMQETVALVLPEMTPEQMEELRMLGQRTGGLVEVDIIPGKRKALDETGDILNQLEGYQGNVPLNFATSLRVGDNALFDSDGRGTHPHFVPENPSFMIRTPNDFPNVARSLVKHNGYIAAFLNALAEEIHGRNVRAGWWTDIETGENILQTRNVGEMLMLTVTEISEAMEADRKKLMDDKLPHRPGLIVELADAVIRILDLAGSRMAIERAEVARIEATNGCRSAHDLNPFGTILVEKLEFNANREDHKIENRRGPNGKRI